MTPEEKAALRRRIAEAIPGTFISWINSMPAVCRGGKYFEFVPDESIDDAMEAFKLIAKNKDPEIVLHLAVWNDGGSAILRENGGKEREWISCNCKTPELAISLAIGKFLEKRDG